MKLDGTSVLVTGGAVRVGRAISLALASRGAHVVIHYNSSADEANALADRILADGGQAATLGADLSDLPAVFDLATRAEQPFGPIRILVNNASVFPPADFLEVDEGMWESAIGVNLRAPFFLSQRLGATMKAGGQGLIINMADLAGIQAWSGYAAHAISKAGLIHLTRVAARALAPEVRVVAIAPGTVLPPEDLSEAEVRALADRAPLRRNGSPDDVVEAILYLVGADFVTGELLTVDGGRLLR